MRKKTHSRWLATLLAVAMCLSMLPAGVLAAEEETVIASWTISSSEQAQIKGGIYADSLDDITLDSEKEPTYTSGNRWGGSGWGLGKGFSFSTPTIGYTVSTISGKVRASKTGPASAQLQGYNGTDWVDLGEAISIGNTSGTTSKAFSVEISETTWNDLEVASFRLVIDSELAGNGNVISTAGTFYIENGLTVSGTSSSVTPPDPTPTAKVATPSCDTDIGIAVEPGSTITLSCETEGVSFLITEDVDNGSWNTLTKENGKGVLVLPQGTWEGEYVRYVKAVKDGLEDSEIITLSFTAKTGGEDPDPSPDPEEPTIKDGTYVIYNPAYNVALSSAYTGFNNNGTPVTVTEGELSGYTNADIWTVVYDTENKTYTISCADGKLSMDAQYTSMPLDKANDQWAFEETGDGLFNVKNVGRNAWIEWFSSKNYWSCYYSIAEDSKDLFALAFYPATATEEPDPEPADRYTPEDGDRVVIYQPGSGVVLTDIASGSRLKGAAATLSGDTLYTDGTELWLTVAVDEAGEYTFTAPDGKVLNTGATGNSLTLVDPTDTEKATATKWALEPIDNGWLIRSTVANYNGNYNQSIEVFGGNFTTYGYKGSDADKAIFTMQFFKEVKTANTVDPDVEEAIAAWGGGGPYNEAQNEKINGDLFAVGDMKDTSAAFTVVAKGKPAKPYQITNAGNHFMGGENIGAAEGDYMQMALSTAGWGDMTLSFRMRVTAAAPASFQVQYSTDEGATFHKFATGSYSYAYTGYGNGGVTYPVSGSGDISDGVLLPSKAIGNYLEFTLDVPAGAENADDLLIRFVPGNARADGTSNNGISGNIRIDSVVLSGHPILSDAITGYVAVDPDGKEEDQPAGTALTMTSATEGAAIYYRFNFNGEGSYQVYDEADKPVLPEPLPANLEVYAAAPGKAQSVKRIFTYAAGTVEAVRMTPNGGGIIFGDEETKTVTLTCNTADATIYYAVDSDEFRKYDPEQPITLNKGFGTATIKAYATRDGFNDSAVVDRTFTERATDRYQLFFGQLHSHTSYSDGAGTAAEAFQHAYDNRDAYNIDFLAVTDHSNSFDNADTCDITDGSKSTEWVEGKGLARDATTGDFVGLFGYEMTWSNGLGHMNTFNTSGFQSRTQADYSTYNTALQNYYAALKKVGGSISQFNHPGNTFGDFSDFAHYDEEIDQLITMIEVGNGEGAIGSSGYFPSYEYYTRALDKGWHVAPTNNQDNHKGGWGTANTGRDVVLVDELTEEAIYDAMRNYRMYATEDLNLSIYYTFDGQIMGTILDRESYPAGAKATIRVELSDADTVAGLGDAGEATVQVIVNGGKVLEEKKAACATTVEFSVPTDYSYYYIKVTQADGDIAVTAPVWVGKVEAVGITALSAASDLTVTGQEQRFTLELYNNEKKPLEVTSIVFTDDKGNVLHTATDVTSVPKLGTASTTFAHTFDADGMVTITATVKGTLDGVEKVYTQNLELSVMPKAIVKRVIVDGTHYNDYVTGYYGGNINNASTIAASLGVEVVVEQEAITAEMLEDCELLVISAPARKSGTANAGAFVPATYEDSFISMVADYVQRGGRVVVCGLADYQDDKTAGTVYQTSVQQNRLLEAIGSTMRINDDEAYDEEKNGGQAYRLYPETFNMGSPWTKGIVEGQTYSQYSGCTVDLGQGTWLVRGFDSTYSIDSDNDGKGGVAKGEAIFLAAEDVGQGTVFAAGGVFLSDFEVKAELDNIWDLPYANRTIFENMLSAVRTEVAVTPIAETRKAELNKIFVVEGYVTNGTTDPNTTFFDAIYIQDETGGTTAFPYSAAGLAEGTKVRILGYTDAYQDDREIQIITLEVLDAPAQKQAPKVLTTAQAMDYETYGGQLLSTSGVVSEIVQANGVVSQFKLTDSSGKAATIFIDGYITNAKGENTIASWLRAGQTVSAVGLLYKHPEGSSDVSVPVFRVRNCDEIQLISQPSGGGSGGGSSRPNRPTRPVIEVLGEENIPLAGALPFVDVAAEDWFYTAVYALYETGMMDGVDETHFAPHVPLTRGMAVTILHRLENSPAVEGGTSFPDVAPGQYYTDGVIWAAANGVVVGCDDGNYCPDAPVTREQMALILCRYAQFKGYEWTAPAALDAFEDAGAVSGYAVEAMGWAVANGLMEGVGGSRLAPAATATRAEIAALLTRFLSQAYIPETAEK